MKFEDAPERIGYKEVEPELWMCEQSLPVTGAGDSLWHQLRQIHQLGYKEGYDDANS